MIIGSDQLQEWIDLLVEVSGSVDEGLSLRLTGAGEELVAGPFAVPAAEISDLMTSLQPTIKRSSRPEVPDPARAAGARLFEALFGGPRARFYPRVQEAARQAGAGVCVRLQLDDPRLRELPWELLYDSTAARSDFLALDPAVCVVREVSEPRPDPLTVPPAPLDVYVHGATTSEGLFEITRLSAGVAADLVTFGGHIGSAPRSGGAAAASEVWHVARSSPLTMSIIDRSAPLVVVSLAASAITTVEQLATRVPAVVAASSAVPERAAGAFVEAFYRALFAGAAIQGAISAGRREADYAQPGGRHWASVICYLTGGGPLVDLGGTSPGEPAAGSTAPPLDTATEYADLRLMIVERNLVELREQIARLGPAAPPTLHRQLAELQRAAADAPPPP